MHKMAMNSSLLECLFSATLKRFTKIDTIRNTIPSTDVQHKGMHKGKYIEKCLGCDFRAHPLPPFLIHNRNDQYSTSTGIPVVFITGAIVS